MKNIKVIVLIVKIAYEFKLVKAVGTTTNVIDFTEFIYIDRDDMAYMVGSGSVVGILLISESF